MVFAPEVSVGWVITPVLNFLGLPMAHAVGTGLGFIFGTSLFSAWRHRKKGNVAAPFDLAGRFIQWSCDQLSEDKQEHEDICLEAAGLSTTKQEDCWAALRLLEKIWS